MTEERRERKRLIPEEYGGDSGGATVVLVSSWGSRQAEPRADAANPAEATGEPPEG